jgi:C4-dicarboxylate transporter
MKIALTIKFAILLILMTFVSGGVFFKDFFMAMSLPWQFITILSVAAFIYYLHIIDSDEYKKTNENKTVFVLKTIRSYYLQIILFITITLIVLGLSWRFLGSGVLASSVALFISWLPEGIRMFFTRPDGSHYPSPVIIGPEGNVIEPPGTTTPPYYNSDSE